jgi:hypothetical protein
VALSPHSDDVPFALGGAVLDGRFADLTVATVYSISGFLMSDNHGEPSRATAVRKAEDREFWSMFAPTVGLLYLDRLDAPLRLGIPWERVCSIVPDYTNDAECAVLKDIIKQVAGPDSLLLSPLGLGEHVDHLLLCHVALALSRGGWAVAFYEDMPYAGLASSDEISKRVRDLNAVLGEDLRPLLLESEYTVNAKIGSLEFYRSQVDEDVRRCIRIQSERLGGGGLVERVWCTAKSLALCSEAT